MSDQTTAEHDGRNDFDFLIGEWRVHNRCLRKRLDESDEWEEFPGKFAAKKILLGNGNMDEITMERDAGTSAGVTMRLFDPNTKLWSIYWADSKYVTMTLPMVGGFKNGIGEFYDHEIYAGKAIFSRFIWTPKTADTCRWEQAFSEDGGRTWETNWTMDFERV